MKAKIAIALTVLLFCMGSVAAAPSLTPHPQNTPARPTPRSIKPNMVELTDAEKAQLEKIRPQLMAIRLKMETLRMEKQFARARQDQQKLDAIEKEMNVQFMAFKKLYHENKALLDKLWMHHERHHGKHRSHF